MNKVAYCTLTENLELAIRNLNTTRPYVDESIVIYEKGTDMEIEELKKLKVTCVQKDWNDNFSEYRNHYLIAARELNCNWVFTTDTDEYPSIELCENIKLLITNAKNYDMVAFNSHDIIYDEYDVQTYNNISSYYKQFLFKLYPKVKYTRRVHHELMGHAYSEIHADDKCYYEHIKNQDDVQIRGCRNFYIGGGGIDEYSTEWKELRGIKTCPLTWHEFRKNMLNGTLTDDVKSWILKYRNVNSKAHHDSELRAFFIVYFEILHPDQNVNTVEIKQDTLIKEHDIIKTFVESEYLRVLGRHADEDGLNTYKTMIENGTLQKEDLEKHFKNSREYKEKCQIDIISNAPFCLEDELKEDISEFTNQSLKVVNENWEIGNTFTLKSWEENIPKSDIEIESWYSNTDAYIYDLAIFHRRNINDKQSFYESIVIDAIKFAHDKNLKVLDFGGGIGTMCLWLKHEQHDVSYYDLNSITSDFAKFRFDKHKADIKFYSNINLPTDQYDFITMIDVIEHLVDINKTLQYTTSLIKSGGYLFATWTFPQNENDLINSPFHLKKYYQWNNNNMVKILKGLGLIEITPNLWKKI